MRFERAAERGVRVIANLPRDIADTGIGLAQQAMRQREPPPVLVGQRRFLDESRKAFGESRQQSAIIKINFFINCLR